MTEIDLLIQDIASKYYPKFQANVIKCLSTWSYWSSECAAKHRLEHLHDAYADMVAATAVNPTLVDMVDIFCYLANHKEIGILPCLLKLDAAEIILTENGYLRNIDEYYRELFDPFRNILGQSLSPFVPNEVAVLIASYFSFLSVPRYKT
jgi:hypothetical protein